MAAIGETMNNEIMDKKETREEAFEKRKRQRRFKMFIKVLVWIGIVGLVIFLTLFLSSRIGLFGSIGEMIEYIRMQF
jgi:cell division septal protein FtsQ